MTRPALHPRPAGLPESIRFCGWCGAAWQKSFTHTCPSRTELPTSPSARAMPVGVSKAPSKYRATPTHVDGIRFASKTEAGLYEYAKTCGVVIVPHVRYPLHCLTSPGIAASWFTPDLTLFCPVTDTTALDRVVVECWEAKGAKACESRDYQLRARAFVRSYPSIPLRVFRKVAGEFVEDTHAAGAAGRQE